jgi:hypothetical protein
MRVQCRPLRVLFQKKIRASNRRVVSWRSKSPEAGTIFARV